MVILKKYLTQAKIDLNASSVTANTRCYNSSFDNGAVCQVHSIAAYS